MTQQTYQGDVLWVIVDDALPITTVNVRDDFRPHWTIDKIFPRPAWMGGNTQARNIKAGVDHLKKNYNSSVIDLIFIIEDDDYYRPVYLEKMIDRKKKYFLIGEMNTIYYNVAVRRHINNNNRKHASLFQTAFTWSEIPVLESCYDKKFIDVFLWSRTPQNKKMLFFDNFLSVGMKGMPGRGGIGAGHRAGMYFTPDTEMKYLKGLIGEDAVHYEHFFNGYNKKSNLFNKKI